MEVWPRDGERKKCNFVLSIPDPRTKQLRVAWEVLRLYIFNSSFQLQFLNKSRWTTAPELLGSYLRQFGSTEINRGGEEHTLNSLEGLEGSVGQSLA